MHFFSLPYALLMLLVLVGYYALQPSGRLRQQNLLLLAASYAFYGWFSWQYCIVLVLATFANFALAQRIQAAADGARRRWVVASLLVNLGVLCYFKYLGFFVDSARDLLGLFGMQLSWSTGQLWLPLGISFFTFQNLGYCLDVYNRKIRAVDDLSEFALFVAFFPQLVVGPIERAAHLMPQIRAPRTPSAESVRDGAWLAFRGVFKKVFVADQLALLCDPLFAPQASYLSGDIAVGAVLFTCQIYADFAGYTDIARGSARMLGFELVRNFRTPYLARNIQDFWSRWHISLTSWITDYLYFGLAVQSRVLRVLRNSGLIVLTMVVMGFWHGASWMFVLWGLYHGLLLAAYRKLKPLLHHPSAIRSPVGVAAIHLASILLTFCVVAIGELLFRPVDVSQSLAMFRDLFTNPGITGSTITALAASVWIYGLVLLLDILEYRADQDDVVRTWPWGLRRLLQLVMFYNILASLADRGGSLSEPFHYVRF
jgi:D-alanyl-lipoteichoic acid acyltransferase DltB (MBOAT superfamily)